MTPTLTALLAVAALAPAPVELRGGRMIMAPIVDISPDGVQVGGDEPRTIAWDNVRSVDSEWAERAAPYKAVSDDAWRARIRLARGDSVLAAPLFERLFPQYRDRDGSLALMVAEGVYQCRYAVGDIAGAFEAWLVAADLRERGVEIAGDPQMSPLLDPQTNLPPKVAPIFLEGSEAHRIADAAQRWLDAADASTPIRMKQIVEAYRAAASRAGKDDPIGEHSPDPTTDAAPLFVAQIVGAESPDASAREAARQALTDYCKGEHIGSWREAWARAAIGRSLILEPDRDLRTQGVIELLHLPARFADAQPNLAAIATAQAAHALTELADPTSAGHLAEELRLAFPGHPAIDWLKHQAAITSSTRSPNDGASS